MLFEQHVLIFNLLLTFDRLKVANKLSDKEISLFVNGNNTGSYDNMELKPNWLSEQVREDKKTAIDFDE